MRSFPCEEDIVKILPHIGVFSQVNDRSGLMPLIIHKELHSTHAHTVRTESELVKPGLQTSLSAFLAIPSGV